MTTEHPITPPPELVLQWLEDSAEDGEFGISNHIATQAARWGADQELEACCEWFVRDWADIETADKLCAFRRPKLPTLKQQALKALEHVPGSNYPNPITLLTADEHALIRRALESLPD